MHQNVESNQHILASFVIPYLVYMKPVVVVWDAAGPGSQAAGSCRTLETRSTDSSSAAAAGESDRLAPLAVAVLTLN